MRPFIAILVIPILFSCNKSNQLPCINISEPVEQQGQTFYWIQQNILFEACEQASAEVGWHFGDGTSDEGFTVTHAYEKPGSYEVKMIVYKDGTADTQRTWIDLKQKELYRITIQNIDWLDENRTPWDAHTGPDISVSIKTGQGIETGFDIKDDLQPKDLPFDYYLTESLVLTQLINVSLTDRDDGTETMLHSWGGINAYADKESPLSLNYNYWWEGGNEGAFELELHYKTK